MYPHPPLHEGLQRVSAFAQSDLTPAKKVSVLLPGPCGLGVNQESPSLPSPPPSIPLLQLWGEGRLNPPPQAFERCAQLSQPWASVLLSFRAGSRVLIIRAEGTDIWEGPSGGSGLLSV